MSSVEYIVGDTPETTFAVPFQFWEKDDLIVAVGGVQTIEFNVTGTGEPTGGEIVLVNPAQNTVVTILRMLVCDRFTIFPIAGPFRIEALNTEFDRVIAMICDIRTIIEDDDRQYVFKAGDTMEGYLTLFADPTDPLHAATKQYVDANDQIIKDGYLPLAGGTMTGFITLHAAPTELFHAANKQYVDDLAGGGGPPTPPPSEGYWGVTRFGGVSDWFDTDARYLQITDGPYVQIDGDTMTGELYNQVTTAGVDTGISSNGVIKATRNTQTNTQWVGLYADSSSNYFATGTTGNKITSIQTSRTSVGRLFEFRGVTAPHDSIQAELWPRDNYTENTLRLVTQQYGDFRYVNVTGDTMTGQLVLDTEVLDPLKIFKRSSDEIGEIKFFDSANTTAHNAIRSHSSGSLFFYTNSNLRYRMDDNENLDNDADVVTRVTGDDRYTRWANTWAQRTYTKGEMVHDDGWLMIANTSTDDRAAPIPQGDPFFVYDGNDPTSPITAKTLLVGNTYTLPTDAAITRYRIYTITGNEYAVFFKNLTTGAITELLNLQAPNTGWQNFATAGVAVRAGESFELGLYVTEPDPTPTVFSGNWNYSTPNNAATPASGQISHANKALDELRVHKTDDDGGDRGAELLGMSNGDIIEAGVTRWSISAITDSGTYVTFTVAPQAQISPDGVTQFKFETVSATPITVVADVDYYLGNTNVRPFYSIDGGTRVLTDNGYNVDIEYQQIYFSPDWDLMALPGGGGGTGGDAPDLSNYYTISETDALLNLRLPIAEPAAPTNTFDWETAENAGQISHRAQAPYIRLIRENVAEGTAGRRWSVGTTGTNYQFIASTNEFGGTEVARLKLLAANPSNDDTHKLAGQTVISTGNSDYGYNLNSSPPALSVFSSTAGRSYDINASTELVVERSASCYLSIISTSSTSGYLNFGDSDSEFVGSIRYDHSEDSMTFWQGGNDNLRIAANGYTLFDVHGGTNGVVIESGGTSSTYYGIQVSDSAGARQFRVRSDGLLRYDEGYGKTTGSAANMYISSAGWLYRSTSSAAYKTEIKSLADSATTLSGMVIDALRPVTFKSLLKGAQEMTEGPGEDFVSEATGRYDFDDQGTFTGFIAEEVQAAIPNMESEPDNYDVRAIVAHLVVEVQNLRREVASLKAAQS